MLLYLIRHGAAVDRTDPACPSEPERPLTREGIKKTRAAMLGLRGMEAQPEAMISSPYVRAAQTAEIACEALGFPRDKVRHSEALKPGGDPAALFKELARVRAKETMCFGHAPQLDQVIAHALGTHGVVTELKKAGVACLEVESFAPPRARLLWMFPPKALRKLGD